MLPNVLYRANETKPVNRTKAAQAQPPAKTGPLNFSHSPGLAQATGTATVIANDKRINKTVNN